jgi:hypothetical protein
MERKSLKKSKGQHSAKTTAENSKQIFPEKELLGLSPHFHLSVSDLYIPTNDLPILLDENCGPILGIYKNVHSLVPATAGTTGCYHTCCSTEHILLI